MKGIMNKGIEVMVLDQHGRSTWAGVKQRAGCEESFYAISEDYPDQTTERLIAAVAEVSGQTREEVLVDLGRTWVPRVGAICYPTFLRLAGRSAREFLGNLDRIHRQVTRNLPTARPPRFTVEERPDGTMHVHYHSRRRLCSLVEGLLLGVGAQFGDDLSVRKLACIHDGSPHCTMEVRFP